MKHSPTKFTLAHSFFFQVAAFSSVDCLMLRRGQRTVTVSSQSWKSVCITWVMAIKFTVWTFVFEATTVGTREDTSASVAHRSVYITKDW